MSVEPWPWPALRRLIPPVRSSISPLRPLPELDGRYAVFGRVVKGLDLVDTIEQGDRIQTARLSD